MTTYAVKFKTPSRSTMTAYVHENTESEAIKFVRDTYPKLIQAGTKFEVTLVIDSSKKAGYRS